MQNEMQRGPFALAGQLQEDGLQEVALGPARLRRALCCCVSFILTRFDLNERQLWLAFHSSSSLSFLDRKSAPPPSMPHPDCTLRSEIGKQTDDMSGFSFSFFPQPILLARLRSLHCAACQTARPLRLGCCFFNQAGVDLGSRACATVEFRCQGHNCA